MQKIFLRIVAVGLASSLLTLDWTIQASVPIPSISAAPVFSRQALNPISTQFPGTLNRRATSQLWEREKLQLPAPARLFNLSARVILSLAAVAGPLHGQTMASQKLLDEPPDLTLWSSPFQSEINRFYASLREIEHRLPNETVIRQLHARDFHRRGILYQGRTVRASTRAAQNVAHLYFTSPRLRDPLMELVIHPDSLDIHINAYGRDVTEAKARLLCLFDALAEIENNTRDPMLRIVARRIRTGITSLVPNSPENRVAMNIFLNRQTALQALPTVLGHLEMIPDNPDAVEVFQGEYSILQGQGWLETFGANPCVIVSLYDPDTKTALLAHIDAPKNVPQVFDQLLAHLDKFHGHRDRLEAGVFTATGREKLLDVYRELKKRHIKIAYQDVLNGNDKSILFSVASGKPFSYRETISTIPDKEVQAQMGRTLTASRLHFRPAPVVQPTNAGLLPRRIRRAA